MYQNVLLRTGCNGLISDGKQVINHTKVPASWFSFWKYLWFMSRDKCVPAPPCSMNREQKWFPEYAKKKQDYKVEKTRNTTFCIPRSLWACWAAFCCQWSTWSGWPVTIVGPERNFFVCFVRFLHLTAGQWQAGDHKKHTMQIGYNTIQIRYLFTQFGSTKWN